VSALAVIAVSRFVPAARAENAGAGGGEGAAAAQPAAGSKVSDWRLMMMASPGFAFVQEPWTGCALDGGHLAGGIYIGASHGQRLGFGLGGPFSFGSVRAAASCSLSGRAESALVEAGVFGPFADWRPVPAIGGLHVLSVLGLGSIEQRQGSKRRPAKGMGGSVGLGYEWGAAAGRVGLMAQLTVVVPLWAGAPRPALITALVATFAVR
jgi:hypothetical protein